MGSNPTPSVVAGRFAAPGTRAGLATDCYIWVRDPHSGTGATHSALGGVVSRVLGVIPARLGSSRLPEKPLQPLLGIPLVLWVWRRARTAECIDRLIVATDSAKVAALCQDAGAEAMLTSPEHATGSDRAWEVVRRLDSDYGVVVNVQGDEPLVEPSTVHAAVSMVEEGFEAATCATAVRDDEEFRDPGVVKVVRTRRGRALYFSRSPIPYGDGAPHGKDDRLRHVGVYAYRTESLGRWVGWPRSQLERQEGLEQLRALENGVRIGVAVVPYAARGVDTPQDLARAERHLRALVAGGRDHGLRAEISA